MTTIEAVRHVRRMRGGAQSHLMQCSDGFFYVVKFRNNPQHVRVLANDLFGSRLAEEVGLPVPATRVVEVGDWLISDSPELNIILPGQTIRCEAGLHFGSRYAVDPMKGRVLDWLERDSLVRVRNLRDFAGVLVLDKWTCNADGRQAAFWRMGRERRFNASFIDQGYCFNAGDWNFPDYPLRGVFPLKEAYEWITGWESFQPSLSRIEAFSEERVWQAAGEIPPQWYGSDWGALQELGRTLIDRRGQVRDRITDFRMSRVRPFPRWVN